MSIETMIDEMRSYIDGHRSVSEPVPVPLHVLEQWLLELECRYDTGAGKRKRPGDPRKAIGKLEEDNAEVGA